MRVRKYVLRINISNECVCNDIFTIFLEINKKAIGYQGGEGKSLEALGFLAKDKIPHHYLCGDGSMIFMPIDDDAVNM